MDLSVRSGTANRTFPVERQGSVMVMVAQDLTKGLDCSTHSEPIIPSFWETSNPVRRCRADAFGCGQQAEAP